MASNFGPRLLGRIEVLFFVAAAVAIVAVLAFQRYDIDPGQNCENAGNWWDGRTRTCGHVVYLPDITHRAPGTKAARYPTLPETAAQGAKDTSGLQ